MSWAFNLIYFLGLMLALPWLLWRRWRKGKRIGGLWAKVFGSAPSFANTKPRIWLHAVSVGEVLCLRPIIAAIRQQFPHYECALSVTTTTGWEVAKKSFPNLTLFWFPFDFTWAVWRTLRCVKPELIILAELELWPNFVRLAKRAGVPIVVVNGRLGEKSFCGYQRLPWLVSPMFKHVEFFAVQSEEYAKRFQTLGVNAERIEVTGSVKFDGVQADRSHAKMRELAELFGIKTLKTGEKKNLIWIVGSTQAPEEEWAIELYREAQRQHPGLRLILVPRHKERFDEVAQMLQGSDIQFVRRSQLTKPFTGALSSHPIILLDTLGELSYVWGLADLGFVGGSFNDRGGQNMIEPAAYGVPVMFGPNVWNFQQIADALLQEEAAIQVTTKQQWLQMTLQLLSNDERREVMGNRAKVFVARQQGATKKTMEILKRYLKADQSATKQAA